MRKRLIVALMLVTITFYGCAKTSEAPKSEEQVTQEASSGTEDSGNQEDEGDLEVRKAHENDEVIGNGSYFVSINGKVFYRRYDEDTFSESNLCENGLIMGAGNLYSNYSKKSELCIYDPATKSTEVFMEDDGFGGLYYANGFFYLKKYDGENNDYTVYRVNIDTREVDHSKDIAGDLLSIDEKTGAIVVNVFDKPEEANVNHLNVYKDDKELMSKETQDYYSAAEFLDGKLYYCIDGDEEDIFYEYDPETNKEVCLGKTNPKKVAGDEFLISWEIRDILKDNDTLYVHYCDYEGSASFYNAGIIYSAKEGAENSIEVLYDNTSDVVSDDGNMYITSDGQIKVDDSKGTYSIGKEYYENKKDANEKARLIYYEDKDNIKTVVNEFANCPIAKSGFWMNVPNNAVSKIGDNVYMMIPEYVRYDINDVGWRPYYRMLKVKYLEITGSGEVNVIDDIPTTENYIDVEASYANDILSVNCVGVPISDDESEAGKEVKGESTFEYKLADNFEYVEDDTTKTKADFENYIKSGAKKLRLYYNDDGVVSKIIKLS